MLKPKFRRWNFFSADEIRALAKTTTSESIWNDQLESVMTVSSEIMVEKKITINLDDGTHLEYQFLDKHHLLWNIKGEKPREEIYNASPGPGYENFIVVHHYRSGLDVPAAATLYMDLETGYVTVVQSEIGRNEITPRDCSNEIKFGVIDKFDVPTSAVKHHFTGDLTGKAVFWAHPELPDRPAIKYLFTSPYHYTYAMRFQGENTYWVGTNPTDYIWMRKGLYLAVYIEERQAGFHIETLMNFNTMSDLQCGFGLGLGGPKDHPDRMEMSMRSNREAHYGTMDTIFDY